ncbi:hypothetical protein PIB30_093879 [Stylosanthes scabra]|uniref:Uncharacterized protein n=1 Tax=Stylosanthes scabra TaxID=79078 RepID=A0ABU6UUL7_9FABA|nr:hypothetical protein [Stylosanthes scabra]
MAAIFPWDRGRKRTDDGLQWQPEVSAEDKANATVIGGVGRQRGLAENGDSGATQWLAEQGLLLPSFGDGEKAGKGLLSTVLVAANTRYQASVDRCSPGAATVEFAEEWWKYEVDDNWSLSAERELLQNDGGKGENPILGLGFNWGCMIQVQITYQHNHNSFAMGLQLFLQVQSEIIKGDKQVNWVMNDSGLSYRQWGPDGHFYFEQ